MQVRTRLFPAIISCAFLLAAASVAQEHHGGHAWDYGDSQGPSHWGELKPEFAPCKLGHRQSPIDIRNPLKADLPPIQFEYRPSAVRIIDNGHTVMINYGPGSFISIGGKKYELKQFHFHRPSEETINGKSSEMVVHLVHADAGGRLAVVAVLIEKGAENPLVRELWNHLPKEKDKEESLVNTQIDASGLLPADRSYYAFPGSLTTPPCTENVAWFVLKHQVSISAEEIEQFSQLYPHNARPTQPLYGRVVHESK